MTLYFENPVHFPDSGPITTYGTWHTTAPLLAVASYTQEKGGFVMIFDELGQPLADVNYPSNSVSQVTALAWHPEKTILACGWETGELKIWNGLDKDFVNVITTHKNPINILQFSEKGSRLVSCDTAGCLVAWKVDSKGQALINFHHDFKETITHVTFRLTIKNQLEYDIEGLAKAAVNGDEHALDIFSNWRPKTTARKFRITTGSDNLNFYAGTQCGSVYFINQLGECMEVLNTEGVPLTALLHHPGKEAVVIMMEGLTVGCFAIGTKGHLTELSKVKLSGRFQSSYSSLGQGIVWAGNGCLVILVGDLIARVWNIETNDNYILPTAQKSATRDDQNPSLNEIFTCVSYSKMNQTLCAGTNIGRLYFWVRRANSENPEEAWELTNINSISGTVKQLMWGSVHLRLPLLSVNCVTTVYIMKEQSICARFSEKIWATQKNASQILLETENDSSLLKLELQVTDLAVSNNYIAVTNGRVVAVYEIALKNPASAKFELNTNLSRSNEDKSNISANLLNTFNCDNDSILIHSKKIIALSSKGVFIKSTSGIALATIPSIASEGEPIGMDINGIYLTVFTMEGFLKIYDISEHDPKLVTPVKSLYDLCNDFGEIIQAKSNSNGTKIALTLAAANLIPDGKLYVWNIEQDILLSYDFHKYGDYLTEEALLEELKQLKSESSAYDEICANRIPLTVFWDGDDPRLLVCDAKRLKITGDKKGFTKNTSNRQDLRDVDHIVVTMFVSPEHGIRIQDVKGVDAEAKLLGVCTPHIVVLEKLAVVRQVMADFQGLENCNKNTRDAVLDFSYNLSLGNMDSAFKAIKLVQSAGVWNSLARMCVKTKRLDVAGVCLGHVGNARAARAVRLAVNDKSLPHEAKLAVLAIQLGMLDEAEQLYKQCERYDLLNKLLQDRNKHEDALIIAETKDRIHLKNTQYNYAKTLEQNGDITQAISMYEKAKTQRADVPRMLLEKPEMLESYMAKTNDLEMLKWWGQYIESQGNMNAALKIYAAANDVYSQVRVLCYLGEENKAADLARSGNDKLAYAHMARHYETVGNVADAVMFFIRANAYNNAVRLCKESHMEEDLWNIGMVAGNREKLECARYFEENGALDKAVALYHRAGMLHKALDLAFKIQNYDTVSQIATDLDATSDPALIEKCAVFFTSNDQFDKAVDLLAVGKKYEEAVKMCNEHNVQLTEDLVEKLTPEKGQIDEEVRIRLLENLGESLMLQGNYHLATKKFTQAGDKVRAMKSLLKSGDTEKIIFFAGVSRQKEIYIMAANYLQSLDWQNQPDILRNIITFYSKGKALDLLANFYVACAQVEIDEFQNYEKAFGAMTEASRSLAKVTTPRDVVQHRRAIEIVQQRLTDIKKFIDIRRLFERGDVQTGLAQCRQLLVSGGQALEESVRRGDIYALMIQNCIKTSNFSEAKSLFDELQRLLKGTVPITYYLNKEIIEGLARGLNVSVSSLLPTQAKRKSSNADEGEIEEVVDDEVQ